MRVIRSMFKIIFPVIIGMICVSLALYLQLIPNTSVAFVIVFFIYAVAASLAEHVINKIL